MTTADCRDAAKKRLHIGISSADTTFDTVIEQFVADMIKQLWPRAAQQVDRQQVSVAPVSGQAFISLVGLTTPVAGVRMVEVVDADGSDYELNDTFQQGTQLRIRRIPSDVSAVWVYGLQRYTLATLPEELELALVYMVVSEFYTFLVGDERQYNAYMQNGRPATEVMLELAQTYSDKAAAIIEDKAIFFGRA